jgi:plasmid stabilization system protein ParE
MVLKVRLSTRAQLDIWEIIEWYESRQAGLGERFSNKLNRLLYEIAKHPQYYSFYKEEFRRAILKPFPYLVIFKIAEEEIVIYSIIYGGRDPQLINKRLS